MARLEDDQRHIEAIARESLETFATISDAAKSHLASAAGSDVSLQIADNSWTSPEPDRNRRRIDQENTEGHRLLALEPAIARVAVVDEDGIATAYFICRAAPVSITDKRIKLASYRSPMGRLAALPVGADHTVRLNGRPVSVEVLEYARFQPKTVDGEWDSRNSIVQGDTYGPVTVESLRRLLERVEPDVDATLLDSLLDEESQAENIREGLRRSVITKMDLRDQPILDQYQDDIFRLPLNSRLLILGAPGTGKTTTLIRRLGQKLDIAFLDEDEQRAVGAASRDGHANHARDWIMFTPTELLKLYVKEAFNREGIPAPDDRISTWADLREDLARNEFSILRSAANNSSFVLKDAARTLKAEAENDAIGWFADFDQWQKTAYWDEMRASAQSLSDHAAPDVARVGARLLTAMGANGTDAPSIFVALLPIADDIRAMVESRKEATDAAIRGALNLQVNKDRRFLDAFGSFVEGLSDLADDVEEQDAEDEDEAGPPRVGRAAAMNHYMRVMRSLARARARKRNVVKTSRTGRILDWLGDRTLPDADLQATGESLLVQTALRWFLNPVRRYVDGTPQRYRRFRRSRQAEGVWYQLEGFPPTDIHPLEVDILLLAMIRSTDDLVRRARRLSDAGDPAQSILERLENVYRTQVLVDEATDFSPIQLSCMATLARPGTRSFFACGDFNQRVTSWGTRSIEQMRWVLPDIEPRTITVAYRQSRRLHELARQLVSLSGDGAAEVVLPDYAENEGVAPVLAFNMSDISETARWLAQRILEIEAFVQALPSIAVLVNSEVDVRPVAAALADALIERNIRVIPCPDGQVRGRESAVRVFNVQHIKGLEFEAVFFLGIDKLAEEQPDLFDKYLYVGTTRAATYLGITCEQSLPSQLEPLREKFAEMWR
ncbi:hypothetical protein ACVWZM_000004 [Bradyrhizobium sp. USDA 4501]